MFLTEKEIQEINDIYQYKVECVKDHYDGRADTYEIFTVINKYVNEGWRLHTIFTHPVGIDASSTSSGHFSTGKNAIRNETVIVMERLRRPAKKESK